MAGGRMALLVSLALAGGLAMGAEAETITVRPNGGGSSVTIGGPSGFGKWFLHFPENMLLDGPGRGKAKMTKSAGEDGTIVVEGKMDGEFAHAIRITHKPGTETIDLTLEVTNLSGTKWGFGGEAMACLRPLDSPTLVGDVGKRTLVYHKGKLITVRDLGQQTGYSVGPTTTVSHPVRGEQMAPHQAQYHKGRVTLDDGVILRTSTDGKRLVAFAWDRVHRVSMNFTHSCMHSNPRVTALAPGERCRRVGRIYFLRCSVDDFWRRYREDFPRKP